MELSISLIEGLLTASITGLVAWVFYLHTLLTETRVDLAKNYHSKEELRQTISDALSPLIREIERLARAIERLEDDKGQAK